MIPCPLLIWAERRNNKGFGSELVTMQTKHCLNADFCCSLYFRPWHCSRKHRYNWVLQSDVRTDPCGVWMLTRINYELTNKFECKQVCYINYELPLGFFFLIFSFCILIRFRIFQRSLLFWNNYSPTLWDVAFCRSFVRVAVTGFIPCPVLEGQNPIHKDFDYSFHFFPSAWGVNNYPITNIINQIQKIVQ